MNSFAVVIQVDFEKIRFCNNNFLFQEHRIKPIIIQITQRIPHSTVIIIRVTSIPIEMIITIRIQPPIMRTMVKAWIIAEDRARIDHSQVSLPIFR